MCLLLKGGGWMSPDGARPSSSGSTKEEDFRLANGMVPHSHTTNGWFYFSIVDCNSWLRSMWHSLHMEEQKLQKHLHKHTIKWFKKWLTHILAFDELTECTCENWSALFQVMILTHDHMVTAQDTTPMRLHQLVRVKHPQHKSSACQGCLMVRRTSPENLYSLQMLLSW